MACVLRFGLLHDGANARLGRCHPEQLTRSFVLFALIRAAATEHFHAGHGGIIQTITGERVEEKNARDPLTEALEQASHFEGDQPAHRPSAKKKWSLFR